MADTLTREAIAYGSQPLSPVPQYWTGATYEKVQGANGATREINYNSSGTEIFTGATPGSVKLTATSTVAISGTSTVSISGSITALNQVVGSANNTWSSSATISAGATSGVVDLQYCYQVSYFGQVTNTATLTLSFQVSQDNSNFYTAESKTITAGTTSPFHYSTTTAARYSRLETSGVSATITATIAGK